MRLIDELFQSRTLSQRINFFGPKKEKKKKFLETLGFSPAVDAGNWLWHPPTFNWLYFRGHASRPLSRPPTLFHPRSAEKVGRRRKIITES